MHWGSPLFVLLIIGMSMLAWVITTHIRAKHGYPIENEWWGTVARDAGPDATRQIELLSGENEDLKGKVSRLEERIAVLERIATDPAERVSREIDKLR